MNIQIISWRQRRDCWRYQDPSGFTHMAAGFVKEELEKMGYSPELTNKGAVRVCLGGKTKNNSIMLAAHMDTLGAMVTEIKSNGRLKLTNVGGMNANNAEATAGYLQGMEVNMTQPSN